MQMAPDHDAGNCLSASLPEGRGGALHRSSGCPGVIDQENTLSLCSAVGHVSRLGERPVENRWIGWLQHATPTVGGWVAPCADDGSELRALLVAIDALARDRGDEVESVDAGRGGDAGLMTLQESPQDRR